MFTTNARRILVAGFLVLVSAGCRKSSPVESIDVRTSGVELHDVESISVAWPGFRGPSGNGLVQSATPTQWSESQNVAWTTDIPGRGHGSPIVVGDLVLLPTALDDEEQQMALAFDRSTGEPAWETVIHEGGFPSHREVHEKANNAVGTFASDGRLVYMAFFNSGKIFASAVDLQGNLVWQEELGDFGSRFGYAPSPVLYKSFLIVAADNFGGGYISALDAATGKLAWRISRPAINSHSTPAIYNLNGRDQMLISGCGMVASYDPATGQENWSTQCTSDTTCGTMVATDDKVFASGGHPDKQTVCLDASGNILWENRVKIYEPSMILVNDMLFAVSDKGIAYCWDADTGDEKWKERLGGNFSSSCWESGGNIYASDLSGKTHIFKATGDQLTQVATNTLGSDCYATPAVADGAIYTRIGTQNGRDRQERLVCIQQ